MSCNKLNFDDADFTSSINFVQGLESTDIDSLIQTIISTLRESSLSVDINESEHPDTFIESIPKLIDSIKDKLTESNKLKFEFTKRHQNILERKLKEAFLPPKRTETEINIEAVIPHVGMLSQEEVENIKLKKVIVDIYGNNFITRAFRETQFKKQLLIKTILDIDRGIPIIGEESLNEGLKNFKKEEYKKLRSFIIGMQTVDSDVYQKIVDYINSLKAISSEDSQKLSKILDKIYSNYNWKDTILQDLGQLDINKQQYTKLKNLFEELVEKGTSFDTDLVASFYYKGEEATSKVDNVYAMMYNYILYLKEKGVLEDMINKSWQDKVRGNPAPFFDALNAYVNLQFFDQCLQQTFGKYIQIDKNYDEPINVTEKGTVYKYSLSTGNAQMVKGWETADYQDAIDQLSGYSGILIDNIKLLSYETGEAVRKGYDYSITPVQFANAIINLRSAVDNLPFDKSAEELKRKLEMTLINPEEWVSIIKSLFNRGNKDKLSQLGKDLLKTKTINGRNYLNNFDLNVLYSIYQTVFNPSNHSSYYSIENRFLQSYGIKNRYSASATLLGVMNSIAGMNYLEVVWDSNDEVPGYKIRIKRKYAANSSIYDIIHAVNRNTYNRSKQEILDTYNISSFDKEKTAQIIFKVGNSNIPVSISFGTHILDKTSNSSFLQEIDGVCDKNGNLEINISSPNVRERLFTDNLTGNERLFMKMLSFVDSMLGTTFSINEHGLLELDEFVGQGGNFKDLFQAATRTLKIIEIYNKLEQDDKYQKTQIQQFLIDNPNVYQREFLTRSNTRKFISKDRRGAYLTAVNNSEKWIDTLVSARMTLNGQVSKAVTRNANNDNVPNTSPTFMADRLKSYLAEAFSDIDNNASSHLLFASPNGRSAVKGVVVDTDITFIDNSRKAIKDLSESELMYHSIVDKFYLPLSQKGGSTVFIQSTTFSDKTKYIGQEISLSDLGIDVYSDSISNICTTRLYSSVGGFYKKIWENIKDDYEKIFGTRDINQIEAILQTLSEQELIEVADKKGVILYKDLHYRNEKVLSLNELLYTYAEDLYTSIETLQERLNIERLNFVNDLISTMTNFYITRDDQGNISIQDPIGNYISKSKVKNYEQDWIKGNRLILAKVINTQTGEEIDVEYSKLSELGSDEQLKLNPFLEAYFSTDILLSNNLRLALTGSEINHKIKGSYDITKILGEKLSDKYKFSSDTTLISALQKLKRVIFTSKSQKNIQEAKAAYKLLQNTLLYYREAAGQGVQLKRNVIIPATMRPYLQNQINGVAEKMRVAVIDDVQAFVQNFDGSGCYKKGAYKSVTIDAHDGFAIINPIMSILENWSLQDNEVGDMKKNILHSYDHRTGVATLFKYAAGAATNSWMRQSELSPISLRHIFKKMSNERWSTRTYDGTNVQTEWVFTDGGKESGVIDLTKCDYKKDEFKTLSFEEDILQGRGLFYKNKGVFRRILNFGKTGSDYYTQEQVVSANGKNAADSTKERLYHYFDNDGRHITSSKPLTNEEKYYLDEKVDEITGEHVTVYKEKYHSIDSLYELYTVMGGINSLELKDGLLKDSEASLIATATFVNFVANKKEGIDSKEISQKTYDQPLKRAFIGYLANNTSVKNGAGQVNPVELYYDDKPFKTMTVSTKGHGVQLDSDHHADEAEMTEFSQVITSLDSGGRKHNYVRQIYNALGKVAIQVAQVELDAVTEFREGNKSKIYDLVGRTIMKNIKEGQKGLLRAIMEEVKKEFNIDSDHANNIFKIPFSDPNIYSQILSTFVSIINRKSIKRQYPGSGMVMMPGYDITTVFDYNEGVYQYQDILKLGYKQLTKEEKDLIYREAIDEADYDKLIAKTFLQKYQNKQKLNTLYDWVYPADRVNIYANNTLIGDINIETIHDYYTFKSLDKRRHREYLLQKLTGFKLISSNTDEFGITKYEISNGKDIIVYDVDPNGNITSLFQDKKFLDTVQSILHGQILYQRNVIKPRNLAPAKIWWTMPDGRIMNIFDHWAIRALYEHNIRDKKLIQAVFDLLNKGLYQPGHFDTITKSFVLDGEPVKVTNIVNNAAECIVPNIFQSKFKTPSDLSIRDIMSNPRSFKYDPELITSDNFDIAFTKNNNLHTYVSFKPIQENSDTFKASKESWDDILVEKNTDENIPDVINRIFALNKDNVKLFEVAREKLIPKGLVVYNEEKDEFVDSTGKILDKSKYKKYGDRVLEVITFVQRRKVRERTGKQTNRYTLYSINKQALSEVFYEKKEGDLNKYIGKLMSDIYNSDDFTGVQLNTSMTTKSASLLHSSLKEFAIRQQHNSNLYNLILGDGKTMVGLRSLLAGAKSSQEETFEINSRSVKGILSKYNKKLQVEIRSSFLKSLYFTASRIPAQSHQSFMKMQAVGFIKENVNHTFVSHFQTWLQGSDY